MDLGVNMPGRCRWAATVHSLVVSPDRFYSILPGQRSSISGLSPCSLMLLPLIAQCQQVAYCLRSVPRCLEGQARLAGVWTRARPCGRVAAAGACCQSLTVGPCVRPESGAGPGMGRAGE